MVNQFSDKNRKTKINNFEIYKVNQNTIYLITFDITKEFSKIQW